MRLGPLLAIVAMACGGVTVDLPDEIDGDHQIGTVLEDLRDCDALRDTFVAVVRQAATDIDEIADVTDGRVPPARLDEKIGAVLDSDYFEIAEHLACNAVSQRVETVERLRNLDPESEAGEDLVTEVIRQIEPR